MRFSGVHRILVILVAMFCTMIEGYCQSSSQNYVRSAVMTEPLTDVSSLAYDVARITIDYYDGLGRPVQNVRVGASGSAGNRRLRRESKTLKSELLSFFCLNCKLKIETGKLRIFSSLKLD